MTIGTEQDLSLEISRRFEAPPEQVFDAWLGKAWEQWLPPRGARCTVGAMEPRPGGRYDVTMAMIDGRNIAISGIYREVVRPKKLVFTWLADYNAQETLITVTFRPDGTGTQMTLRQDGFRDRTLRDGYHGGWSGEGGSFDKLDRLLTQTVLPDPTLARS